MILNYFILSLLGLNFIIHHSSNLFFKFYFLKSITNVFILFYSLFIYIFVFNLYLFYFSFYWFYNDLQLFILLLILILFLICFYFCSILNCNCHYINLNIFSLLYQNICNLSCFPFSCQQEAVSAMWCCGVFGRNYH